MADIINFRDFTRVDPILRKGDLVRLINMDKFEDEGYETEECLELENTAGIVTGIEIVFGEDSDFPGQAAYLNVAFPCSDDGWNEIYAISIYHVRRVIGIDSYELRGYGG